MGEPWPAIEYEDGYPEDEQFINFEIELLPPDFKAAAEWRLLADHFGANHRWEQMADDRADLRAKARANREYDINDVTRHDCYDAADAVIALAKADAVIAREESCCEGGPQWGHALSCPEVE